MSLAHILSYIHCLVDLFTSHGFNSYLIDELNNYTFYLDVSPGIEVEILTTHIQIRERHRQRQRKDSSTSLSFHMSGWIKKLMEFILMREFKVRSTCADWDYIMSLIY